MFVSQVPCADAGASHGLLISNFDWSTGTQWERARKDKWALRVLGLQPLPEETGDHAGKQLKEKEEKQKLCAYVRPLCGYLPVEPGHHAVLSTAGRQDALALRVAQSDGGVSDTFHRV